MVDCMESNLTMVEDSPVRRLPWVLASGDNQGASTWFLGPNWFASVMGTGIVANAGATLPTQIYGQHTFALVTWILASLLLVGLLIATGMHWLRNPAVARSHGRDVSMAQFYGAPPMALLTVGLGALLVGKSVLGTRLAVDLDWVLWTAGTILGLFTVTIIPYRLFTQLDVGPDSAFGGWLMPIVPPMVSAATGAALIPHVASFNGKATMLYALYVMFGMSLVASLIVITLIWSRLVHYGTSGTSRVPTLWIVLGPLGQSITAAGLLGAEAHLAAPHAIASAFSVFGVLYGVPVWGFAVLWIVLAGSLTIRTARRKLPFALTWWSFTFPVGTFVTGTSRLAIATKLPAFHFAAAVAYVGLLAAWAIVAVRTFHGARRGDLFKPPSKTAGAPIARKG